VSQTGGYALEIDDVLVIAELPHDLALLHLEKYFNDICLPFYTFLSFE
jgi:hypothetical protein